MNVEDIMVRRVFAVEEDDELWRVMLMLNEEKGTMLVCVADEAGRLRGLLTPKRLLRAVAMSEFASIRQPSLDWGEALSFMISKRVGEVMGPPISVKPKDHIIDAIGIMIDKNLYTLPVVDEDSKIIGRVGFYNVIDSWAGYLRREKKDS